MIVTPEEIMEITPYTGVTTQHILHAQFVIELFIGKDEIELIDPQDKQYFRRSVIAQTIYMKDNPNVTFQQIMTASVSRGDGITTFKAGDFTSPFIAPLALMALKRMSWSKSRTIKMGRMTYGYERKNWRTD